MQQNNNQDPHKKQGEALLAGVTLNGAKITQNSRADIFDTDITVAIAVPRAITNMCKECDKILRDDEMVDGAGDYCENHKN